MDFVSDALTDGRRFHILAVVDEFSREDLVLIADNEPSSPAWRSSNGLRSAQVKQPRRWSLLNETLRVIIVFGTIISGDKMRQCLKEPIPEIFSAWEALSAAVDEHIAGNNAMANELFEQANSPAVWSWLNPAWVKVNENVTLRNPVGDTQIVAKEFRDPDRNIASPVRAAVLKRDGYRCRYCGIPVVHADIRKIAAKLYPRSVPWDTRDPAKQHAGFQCLWLQFDHVEPHCHGGRSTADNVVISCALCNFGKDKFTLRQLDIEDPRLRKPEPLNYDGLERLRRKEPKIYKKNTVREPAKFAPKSPPSVSKGGHLNERLVSTFFLPGAWISKGYLYSPPIEGKERWFLLSDDVEAEPATFNGTEGCLLICAPELFIRRGIDHTRFLVRNG